MKRFALNLENEEFNTYRHSAALAVLMTFELDEGKVRKSILFHLMKIIFIAYKLIFDSLYSKIYLVLTFVTLRNDIF